MKSKLIKAIVACVVIAALGVGGYVGYNTYSKKNTTVSTAKFYTTTVKKMNLSKTISGTGSVYAATTKDVSASNNGTLGSLSVKVGDSVTAGQTLFVSDSDEVRASVTTAQNNLTKQKLSLSSDESADKVDDNKVAQDKLSVSDAETALSTANTNVSKMTVTSPLAGVITAVNNANGDSVQAGKSVLTVVDMNSLKIKVSVDETDISKVKVGQTATIKFDAISDKSFEGTVETIAETGTTSNSVTTYDVVVGIKNPSGIKLGMNATVTIAVESKENALVIPTEALVQSNSKKYVRVQDSTSSASNFNNSQNSGANSISSKQTSSSNGKLVEIKTGIESQNYIEVTEGVTEGEQLIVQLPSSSSSSSSKNGMGGGPGGDMMNGGGFPGGGSGGFSGGGTQGGNGGGQRSN